MSSPRHRITLAGSEHAVEPGTTVGGALDGGPNVIAARVNGELRDLAWPLADGDVVEPVDIASDDGHYIVRRLRALVAAAPCRANAAVQYPSVANILRDGQHVASAADVTSVANSNAATALPRNIENHPPIGTVMSVKKPGR